MKHRSQQFGKIIIALLIGFLTACSFTDITYSCEPIDGARGCVSFEKAITHPGDLLANKQDSLIRFVTNFVIFSCIAFALLWVIGLVQKKQTKPH